MLIGAMNHPAHDVIDEIKWMAEMELDFIDLTLEPPRAATWRVDAKEIKKVLDGYGLQVMGHTAYYLPIASPFESVRRAALDELKCCIEVFAAIGAPWMNIHPDRHAPLHEPGFAVQRNIQTLNELMPSARDFGVGIMIENIPGGFNTTEQLGSLLDPLPELGLHLDIGHTNLMVERNTTDSIIATYGSRLCHVHLHDNKGGSADLHLPLGAGTIDVRHHISTLKASGYDGTITLEVFSPDRRYLEYSREVLRRIWDECPAKPRQSVLV